MNKQKSSCKVGEWSFYFSLDKKDWLPIQLRLPERAGVIIERLVRHFLTHDVGNVQQAEDSGGPVSKELRFGLQGNSSHVASHVRSEDYLRQWGSAMRRRDIDLVDFFQIFGNRYMYVLMRRSPRKLVIVTQPVEKQFDKHWHILILKNLRLQFLYYKYTFLRINLFLS